MTFSLAASSCAAMLNAGSPALFFLPSMVVLSSRLNAFEQSGATSRRAALPCSVSRPIVMPVGSDFASVRSRIGACLPFEHDDQFFQKPIVRVSPPGGGVLSTVRIRAWPGWTVKSAHNVLLSPLALKSVNGFGPREVFQPGMTTSHSW